MPCPLLTGVLPTMTNKDQLLSTDACGQPHEFPRSIEIPGDLLVPDEDFRRVVLNGASRKTGGRLDLLGLPFIFVAGHKFRPLNEGRQWLAARIQRRGQPPPQ